jgi:hypothetical protein
MLACTAATYKQPTKNRYPRPPRPVARDRATEPHKRTTKAEPICRRKGDEAHCVAHVPISSGEEKVRFPVGLCLNLSFAMDADCACGCGGGGEPCSCCFGAWVLGGGLFGGCPRGGSGLYWQPKSWGPNRLGSYHPAQIAVAATNPLCLWS